MALVSLGNLVRSTPHVAIILHPVWHEADGEPMGAVVPGLSPKWVLFHVLIDGVNPQRLRGGACMNDPSRQSVGPLQRVSVWFGRRAAARTSASHQPRSDP